MSLISHDRLLRLVADGVITGVTEEMVNAASIDITVGSRFIVEAMPPEDDSVVSLRDRTPPTSLVVECADGRPFMLPPGGFCLAQSQQKFNLPANISAEYKLKSSLARVGMNHLLAGWCDAGWNGSVLTLELHNVLRRHSIAIREGDRIGQMIFFEHEPVPQKASYATRGRYNGDDTVKGMKA